MKNIKKKVRDYAAQTKTILAVEEKQRKARFAEGAMFGFILSTIGFLFIGLILMAL